MLAFVNINESELGFPIGLIDDIIDFVKMTEITLHTGDVVVLYTDGITEAMNVARQVYGLPRLCEIARAYWEHSVEAIKDAIVNDVQNHIGEQKVSDDITVLVLKQK